MIVKHTNFINNLTFVAGIHQIFTSSLTYSHNILSVPLTPSVMAYHPTMTTRQIMRTRILQRTPVSSTNSNNNINGIQRTRHGATGEPFAWTGHGYYYHGHYPYRKNILLLDDRVSSTTASRSSTRLFCSNPNRRGNDDEKNDNKVTGKLQQWASKAAKKVKSILPKSWTSSSSTLRRQRQQEEQQQQQQQQQQDISSSLDSLFRDSPLGIRLMGNMIVKPLISSLAGSLAQTMQEQQREMSDLLEEARTLILCDENLVASLGGEPIQVSPPFSQSSSSSTVSTSGGRMEKQSRVEASFQVTGGRGSYGSGVATMVAMNGSMERLYVNVQGRYYEVNVEGGTRGASSTRVVVMEEDGEDVFGARKKTRGAAPSPSSRNGEIGKNHNQGKGGGGKDDIIDAEFVDKKVFKR